MTERVSLKLLMCVTLTDFMGLNACVDVRGELGGVGARPSGSAGCSRTYSAILVPIKPPVLTGLEGESALLLSGALPPQSGSVVVQTSEETPITFSFLCPAALLLRIKSMLS